MRAMVAAHSGAWSEGGSSTAIQNLPINPSIKIGRDLHYTATPPCRNYGRIRPQMWHIRARRGGLSKGAGGNVGQVAGRLGALGIDADAAIHARPLGKSARATFARIHCV